MAELRANLPSARESAPASVTWPLPMELDEEAELPRGCIELHGLSYLAFCKAWGPVFVKPEEDDAD